MTKKATRAEIYDAIWKEPMCVVAKRYEIAPSTMSKLCQRHRIPAPARGHWSRVEAGYVVARPPLPNSPGNEQVSFNSHGRRTSTPKKKRRRAPLTFTPLATKPVCRSLYPSEGFKPKNYYVAALQSRIETQIMEGRSTLSTHGRSEFRISILPQSAQRVVRILDTLCVLAEMNEFDIRPSKQGLAFGAGSYRVCIAVTEQITLQPTAKSRLELRLDNLHHKDGIQRRFADHRRSGLEEVLSSVVSSIKRCALAARQREKHKGYFDERLPTIDARMSRTDGLMNETKRLANALDNLEKAARECRQALAAQRSPISVHPNSSYRGQDAK